MRRIIEKEYALLLGEAERLRADEDETTLFALENLQTYPCVPARLADGSLRVHAWFFKIATAELFAYDPESKQFEALTGVNPPKPRSPPDCDHEQQPTPHRQRLVEAKAEKVDVMPCIPKLSVKERGVHAASTGITAEHMEGSSALDFRALKRAEALAPGVTANFGMHRRSCRA